MAKPRTELGSGAGHVAWHSAVAARTGLSNEKLDLRFAKYRANGEPRDGGGSLGTFRAIAERACDPRKTYATKSAGPHKNMSVYEAVSRDPEVAHINHHVLAPGLWRLLSRPEVSDHELKEIIQAALRREGLYRAQSGDRELGMFFLRDKDPFEFADREMMEDLFKDFASKGTINALTILAALSREQLRVGAFDHIESLRMAFERCLMTVAFKYGFSRDLEILIQWLAGFRIFANRWDPDIPNETSRAKALAHINARREESGQKSLSPNKYNFWVEALAVRYHSTQAVHRYMPVVMTPELAWLEEHRGTLKQALTAWDRRQPTSDLWSPLIYD